MGDHLIMSKKERERKVILSQVDSGDLSRSDASKRLGLSIRQLRRIVKRYRTLGDAGLVHRSRGRVSNRAYPSSYREKILRIYEEKYAGFGPTLASEKLLELDGLSVHPETLRLWLKGAGLWLRHRRRNAYRSRRARRSRYGELLQLDGSIHDWFSQGGKKACLMNLVDDATGKTLALMDYGETTRSAFSLLDWWISESGIPLAIYVDLKSMYVSPKALKKDSEESAYSEVESEWLTHFSMACKKLGIEVIKAYSPQAKGRVERSHAVYQDRFVKELQLRNITNIDDANQLLREGFVNKLNEKFAKAPASPEDAHVPLLGKNMDEYLCWWYERQVKNDWTIQYKNQFYQLEKSQPTKIKNKQKIQVCQHLDGRISLWSDNKKLSYRLIESYHKSQGDSVKTKKEYTSQQRANNARKNKHKTPWGKYQPAWEKKYRRTQEKTVA